MCLSVQIGVCVHLCCDMCECMFVSIFLSTYFLEQDAHCLKILKHKLIYRSVLVQSCQDIKCYLVEGSLQQAANSGGWIKPRGPSMQFSSLCCVNLYTFKIPPFQVMRHSEQFFSSSNMSY